MNNIEDENLNTYILPVFLRKTPMRHETCALAFAI